jgi:hypothetical protein
MLSDRGKENDLRKVRITCIIQMNIFSFDENRRIYFLCPSKDAEPMTKHWNYGKSGLTRTQPQKAKGVLLCCFRTSSPAFIPLISATLPFLSSVKTSPIIYEENFSCIDWSVVLQQRQ